MSTHVSHSETELQRRRLVAEEAAAAAAAVHIRYRVAGIEYEMKNGNRRDLVTRADTEGEAAARAIIEAAFPGEAIVGEEDGKSREEQAAFLAGRCWLIDPLDGTFNFVHGFPDFSATVAFVEQGQPLSAATFALVFDEMFSAARGQGATLNGAPISISKRRGLAQAVVNVTIARSGQEDETSLAKLARVRQTALFLKTFGGTAIILAYVACGRFDLFYAAENMRTGPWDMAAGALLIEEAGGYVCRADGSPFALPATSMAAAADPAMLDELRELIGA
ncbi:MAG TPA: inositol monophosphatase [Dehalococcoidia bacterium]